MRQIRVTPHQGRLQIVFEMEDDSQMAVSLEPEQAEALGLTLVNCVQFPDDLNRSLFAETPQVSVTSPRFEVTGSLETSQIVCAFRAATMRPWQLQFPPQQAEELREQLDAALKLVRTKPASSKANKEESVVPIRKKTD